MKTLIQLLVFSLVLTGFQGAASGQQSFEVNEAAKAEVSRLSFLEGKWKGSGWMIAQDQKRYTFEQEENIQVKLGGTALLIEGLGTSDGKVIHNALAVITDAEGEGKFDFTSFLQNGRKGTFKAELIGEKLHWFPTEQVRYIIEIKENGQWFEIGEYNAGGNWIKFFEMTLSKL
ncbi:MAG TPA: hypothetical protein VLA71_14680 [Algoriphagus sp.]|nr:hypothetical protein [Algoriphagus sp.]